VRGIVKIASFVEPSEVVAALTIGRVGSTTQGTLGRDVWSLATAGSAMRSSAFYAYVGSVAICFCMAILLAS